MLFNIILMSKNKLSLLKLCTYFNKKIVKTTLLNFYLISQKNCLNKKVKITVLKSPHVNKKAKEKFQLVYYKINLMFFSVNLNKDLLLLKKLNDFLFSDVKVKVIYQINKKLLVKMLRLNPNSFKNLKKKNVSTLKVFDCFGENCFIDNKF